jgi:predicted nucleic-acid-binding protein
MAAAVLDANFILRLLLGDVPEQLVQAQGFMENLRRDAGEAIVPQFVLTECVFVMTRLYGVPRKEIASLLRGFLAHPGIVGQDTQTSLMGLSLYENANVSIVDALLVAMVKVNGGELQSFDRDLRKLAATTLDQT